MTTSPLPATRELRPGQAARLAGVGLETLRYYERRGLLPAPRTRPSGHRVYDLDDVRLLRAIKMAQRLGFTLAETQDIVRVTRRDRVAVTANLQAQAEAKLREVEERIRGLELLRAELRSVIDAGCDALIGCGCGDDCPVEPVLGPSTPHQEIDA